MVREMVLAAPTLSSSLPRCTAYWPAMSVADDTPSGQYWYLSYNITSYMYIVIIIHLPSIYILYHFNWWFKTKGKMVGVGMTEHWFVLTEWYT